MLTYFERAPTELLFCMSVILKKESNCCKYVSKPPFRGWGFQSLHHFFNHAIGGGTIFYILFVHVHVLDNFFSWQVRKAGTIIGSDFINSAHIRGKAQKLAGRIAIHQTAG